MFCHECGKKIGAVRFCPYCGIEQVDASKMKSSPATGNTSPNNAVFEAQATPVENKAVEKKPGMSRGKKILFANCAVFAVLLVLVGVGLGTAVRWEKVDVPAHKETFHTEQKDSGMWDVKDDHESPCYVGQDWTDCINLYIDQYNGACAERSLTGTASVLCENYSNEIERMKSEDEPNYYVASLGTMGHLAAEKYYTTVNVSNNDYVPAKTHEAMCVFGFIGECDF